MRSKVAERILNNYKSKPWWYRLRIWIRIQFAAIKCLGIARYFKNKIVQVNRCFRHFKTCTFLTLSTCFM